MDPHIIDWAIKTAQVPREFEVRTYQIECDASAICNTLYLM